MSAPSIISRAAPFPSDVPIADIPRIKLTELQSGSVPAQAALFDACRTYGFLHLDLRGSHEGEFLLSDAEAMFDFNRALHELELDEKMKFPYEPPNQLFGYKHLGRNKVESGEPDRYEAFTLSQDDILGVVPPFPNPALVGEKRLLLQSYVVRCRAVADHVFASLARSLSLPPGAFADLHPENLPSGTSLRLLRYPPHPPEDRRSALVGHTDIGSITLLFAATGGLQVLLPDALCSKSMPLNSIESNGDQQSTGEKWLYVKPEEGHVLVNMGDAMVEWSGGQLRSDLHRVTWAPGLQATEMRFSVAFLMRPEHGAHMLPLVPTKVSSVGEHGAEISIDSKSSRDENSAPVDEAVEKIWTALEWERRKSRAIISGRDVARSKGGVILERPLTGRL